MDGQGKWNPSLLEGLMFPISHFAEEKWDVQKGASLITTSCPKQSKDPRVGLGTQTGTWSAAPKHLYIWWLRTPSHLHFTAVTTCYI